MVQQQTLIVGRDPGFSAEKVCLNGVTACLQSEVAVPRNLGLAGAGMSKASRRENPVVEFAAFQPGGGSFKFTVDEGAWRQGRVSTSLDYNDLQTPERWGLFYAALVRAGLPVDEGGALPRLYMVVSLPVPLLTDKSRAVKVLAGLRAQPCDTPEHRFTVNGKRYGFTLDRRDVVPAPQPIGAYLDWLYDDDLNLREGGPSKEVLLLDFGFNTFGHYAVQNAMPLAEFIGGDALGAHQLLQLMELNGAHSLMQHEASVRNGDVVPSQRHLQEWLRQVGALLTERVKDLRRFDVVIPCGGGVSLLGPVLREYLDANTRAEQKEHARRTLIHWPTQPRLTNVIGCWKLARKNLRRQLAQ